MTDQEYEQLSQRLDTVEAEIGELSLRVGRYQAALRSISQQYQRHHFPARLGAEQQRHVPTPWDVQSHRAASECVR